jgi:hypothetical protein
VRLLLAAALTTVPVLATGLPVSRWVIAGVWLLCGVAAAASATANARRDRDDRALARLLGLTDGWLFTGRVAVPVVVSTVWCTVAMLAVGATGTGGGLGAWALLGLCAGPGLAAGALRSARRKQVRHDIAPLVSPTGTVPTGLVMWLAGGVDLAVLALWPALFAIVTQRPEAALANQVLFSAGTLAGIVLAAKRG